MCHILYAQENSVVYEKATFGGGCFWCLEAVFEETRGVVDVISGYAGGQTSSPTYEQVCSGNTGHAEVVQITFDPKLISYEALLKIFWLIHDPTTLNRQGNDVGTQYRSVIFYHNETQKTQAEASMKAFASKFTKPIVTEIKPLEVFYKAEAYHQNYFKNNPNQGYCMFVVSPKVEHFKHEYKDLVK
ncbi:peptide-methionine (S)-S-oxide reductase MsrA [Sulfurospirillum sp. hDNRA2]|uniref:peptide-methionine (S)-S-oxide reductase MsrA n=1 Tax=Sulfurospirillum sp. hDNRA2 TaxID=3237298 RepID=UPI0020B80EDA|nr:peptide-methionine (S)-S-oxide reductase MsrA [Sulfurospirillum sp. DNRA8]MCP3652414.1 peptide-methionine (S)-S-oxide reductase MsrA [Sulfurospirillum sp. DNRA8]MCR1811265.1 peptide-methionine (S)-S-oxide reductase MsrA [Sulfurospirillum sp. DNRA8]